MGWDEDATQKDAKQGDRYWEKLYFSANLIYPSRDFASALILGREQGDIDGAKSEIPFKCVSITYGFSYNFAFKVRPVITLREQRDSLALIKEFVDRRRGVFLGYKGISSRFIDSGRSRILFYFSLSF